MEGSWLDSMAGNEKRNRLKRMMSPEAYERLREKVKGPEDLEKELKRGEQLAELSFELQTNEKLREHLKSACEKDVKEQGIEAVMDTKNLSPALKQALEQGKFLLVVASHPTSHNDQLVVVPEGNIQDKIPLKSAFSDRYVAQFLQGASPTAKMQDLAKRSRQRKAA